MILNMLKSKIHRAVVTEANLNYVGSITIDQNLLEAAGIIQYEQVQVVDIDNGNRFETYVINGPRASGVVCLNGAAARMVCGGDRLIIMAYGLIDSEITKGHLPQIVLVDGSNRVLEVRGFEEHGQER